MKTPEITALDRLQKMAAKCPMKVGSWAMVKMELNRAGVVLRGRSMELNRFCDRTVDWIDLGTSVVDPLELALEHVLIQLNGGRRWDSIVGSQPVLTYSAERAET